jgi:hypothetical protein
VTTTPAVPEPDTKNWTWSTHAACPDCGYDPNDVERDDVAALTRRYAGAVADALTRPDAAVRPEPAVWAPVEYGCHVRDVCTLYAARLELMLTQDDPLFDNWDQDVTALEQQYWTADPSQVAAQLRDAAAGTADAFAAITDDQWPRPGRRSDGSVFTVDTFARYFLHDLAHHAWDVRAR